LKLNLLRVGALSESKDQSDKMPSEDADIKMLNAKRMVELRKRMNQEMARKTEEEQRAERMKNQPTDREILVRALRDRGDEVLNAAERAYPREMKLMIPQLAALIKQGKIASITGGELLQFFRSIGMRVSVSTSISVEDHGKFVSLADKLKQDRS
jgi:DNA-binding TFAR19-related protein (PDSD5 family)